MNKKKRITLIFMALILFLAFINIRFYLGKNDNINKSVYAEELEKELTSQNNILVGLEDGEVLAGKNANDKTYPASLTKIMTSIVVLENLEDKNVKLRVEKDVLDYAYREGASTAGFKEGELVRAKDLLYGTMLLSGAESSLTLANYLEGSEEGLVSKMNKLAKEIGMERTNFTNVTGLHDENHYTTAGDMAKLLAYALENKDFRKIISTNYYMIAPTNEHKFGRPIKSRYYGLASKSKDKDIKFLGGKTGYTSEAGLCLASWSKYEGKEYISIVLGADGDLSTEPYHLLDTIKLYK